MTPEIRRMVPRPLKNAIKFAIGADDETRRQRRRLEFAMSYYLEAIARARAWAPLRTEETNFYYDLSELNRDHLAQAVAVVAGLTHERALSYFREIEGDQRLRLHLERGLSAFRLGEDARLAYGRRVGWYAMVRALKPATVVETGVDLGVGACVLCAALLRNREEGDPGHYFGTELRTEAAQLFGAPYDQVGEILFGDSIESLKSFGKSIDLFINDSDHSAEYEYREYQTVAPLLSSRAVILGDNSHVTDKLSRFSREQGRKFFFFAEQPKDHWYPGAGIGISWPATGIAQA